MRTVKTLVVTLVVGMMLTLAGGASAKNGNHGSRWARPHVAKYYKERGWPLTRVQMVRMSKSGKSTQVLGVSGATVNRLNVLHSTGKVSATRTGLVSQAEARSGAFRYLTSKCQVRQAPIVENAGLSASGKSYRFIGSDSRTSTEPNFAVYFTVKKGRPNNFTRTSTF